MADVQRTAERGASLVRLGWYTGASLAAVIAVLLLIMSCRDGLVALEEARDHRRQVRQAAGEQAERRQHLAALQRRPKGGAAILAAGSEGEAQAHLQRHLSMALQTASAQLSSLEVLPTVAADGFRRILLRADFRVELSGLQRLLHDLEFGLPLVAVERLRISAPGHRAIGADRQLSVDLEIVALQQPAGP